MVLNYTPEQYAVAAGEIGKATTSTDRDRAIRDVASSACEEILKLAEQNRILRRIIADAATDLRGKLDHFDRFSS